MPFSLDQAFGVLPQALQLQSQRASLLASNIANADTPGYKARDIDFKAALQAAQGQPTSLPLMRTNAGRNVEPTATTALAPVKYQVPLQPSLDGNTVDLQRNQAEFGENALRYQATLTILTSRIDSLRKALTGQ